MSSLSPDQNGSQAAYSQASLSPPNAGSSADQGKGLSLGLNIFKNLTEKRNPRVDGTQPKKRGPKPDSKPALTRRQELNRQAQRTHRERKELYVRALEEEVMRLKEAYTTMSRDKTQLADENKQLRELLAQYGVPFPGHTGPHDGGNGHGDGHHFGGSASGYSHGGGSYGVYSPGATSQSTAPSISSSGAAPRQHPSGQNLRTMMQQASTSRGFDYDQAGIDFVLTLERPCMEHLPFLLDRSNGPECEPCGHALMASCPPKPFNELPVDLPFGSSNIHDTTGSGQRTWEITKADLATLMDLSTRIDLDGEITPVMAWGMVMSHPRFVDLDLGDLQALTDELGRKVRCYGFGAVTEEFEVRDALDDMFSRRQQQQVMVE